MNLSPQFSSEPPVQAQGYNAEQIGAVLAWTGLPQLILIPLVPRLMQRFDTRYIAFTGLIVFAYSCFMNPLLMAELDAMKALRPTGGLMLRRDSSGLPRGGKGEMLTQVERISKKIIVAAGLRPELTFTSFGRQAPTSA